MTFIRTKRVHKNGKTYEYQYRQKSVRVGRRVKSIHLGKPDDHWPGKYGAEKMQEANDRYVANAVFNYAKAVADRDLTDKAVSQIEAKENAAPKDGDSSSPSQGNDVGS